MPQPPSPPHEPLGECYIDKLPDELLAEILSYFPPQVFPYEPLTYEQCPLIALVCKRWERNYDATLYQMVSLSEHPRLQQVHTGRNIKILREQAELRHHVRQINVHLDYISEATCGQITDIIKSCPTVRTVSLCLNWSVKPWPIVRAVGMLPRLEVLWLSGFSYRMYLQMILGYFNHPTLRELRLCYYSLAKFGAPAVSLFPFGPPEAPSQDELDELSVVARSRSSAITSLELTTPYTSPLCTMILVDWPSKLVRLSLTGLTDSMNGSHYTLDVVERIFNIHRDSLQHITVGRIQNRPTQYGKWVAVGGGIPDFSKFQCLRELQIFADNMLAEKPSEAAAKLAAPLLRHLTMEFGEGVSHVAFAGTQLLWMAEFASKGPIGEPNTNLQTIFVDFQPICDSRAVHHEKAGPWPWEYLQQAKKEFSRYNVALTYSEPSCTKEEWDEMMRGHPGGSGAQHGSPPVGKDLQTLEISDDESQA